MKGSLQSRLRARLYGNAGDCHPYRDCLVRAADTPFPTPKRVLIFGAGRGTSEIDVRGSGRTVVGVDVSLAIRDNPYLDHAAVYHGEVLPFANASFDLCGAFWVVEHLPDPSATFSEIARVLRPGGRFIFATSNAWFYAMIGGRLVPNRFHAFLTHVAIGRDDQDTFPTYYRANTRRRLRSLLTRAGLNERSLQVYLFGPAYLEFSLPTFLLGILYERLVNATEWLADLRHIIVGDFVKPFP